MAIRDKLRERIQPHLEEGEEIRHVLIAQTGPSPYLGFLTYLIVFWMKQWAFAVTDRAVVILQTSIWQPTKPRSVVARLPRETRLGPLSGLWGKKELNGAKYYIHKRFHKDVDAADAEITQAVNEPPTT